MNFHKGDIVASNGYNLIYQNGSFSLRYEPPAGQLFRVKGFTHLGAYSWELVVIDDKGRKYATDRGAYFTLVRTAKQQRELQASVRNISPSWRTKIKQYLGLGY